MLLGRKLSRPHTRRAPQCIHVAELMTDNSQYLSQELTCLIDSLSAYRDALDRKDEEQLKELLAEGDRIKRVLDSNTPDND